MIISADHIQLIGDGVLCPGPEYLQNLVMSVKGGVDYIRVVDGGTAKADKISCNIIKSGLGIAGRHKLNPLVASIQFKRPSISRSATVSATIILGARLGDAWCSRS